MGTIIIKSEAYIQNATIPNGYIIATFIVPLLFSLAFYALRSIGLFVMAKKRGFKNAYLAFIPCVWTYTACKLVRDTKFFGFSFDKLAIYVAIIFSLGEVLSFAHEVILYFPYANYYLFGGSITINLDQGLLFLGNDFILPANYPTSVSWYMQMISWIADICNLVSLVVLITLYINLFRKYLPNHYIVAAVLSAFGLFAPFVFAVRNRNPVNYVEYMRTRYGGINAYYNSPYENNPNYTKPPETPFEEFAERGEVDPGDPFADFNDKDQDDK